MHCCETLCTVIHSNMIQTVSLHRCYHLCDSVTLHVTNSLLHVSLHFKAESTATRQCRRPFCHTFREAPTQTSVHCVCLLRTSSCCFPAEHIFIPLSSRTSASSFRAGISSYFPAKFFTLCPFAPPSSRGAFKPKTLPATFQYTSASTASLSGPLPTR